MPLFAQRSDRPSTFWVRSKTLWKDLGAGDTTRPLALPVCAPKNSSIPNWALFRRANASILRSNGTEASPTESIRSWLADLRRLVVCRRRLRMHRRRAHLSQEEKTTKTRPTELPYTIATKHPHPEESTSVLRECTTRRPFVFLA